MKLRSKVLATLIPLTVLFVIITNLVGANMITSEAIKNDEMEANEAVKRIGVGLENMESILTIKCGDYSYWDDTWSYLQTLDPAFVESNLQAETFLAYDVDVLCLYNNVSALVYSIAVDSQNWTEIEVPAALLQAIEADEHLIYDLDEETDTSGILAYEGGSVLFSSCPVMRSDGSGPVMGTMIMAVFLDVETENYLTNTFGNTLTIGEVPDSLGMSSMEEGGGLSIENVNHTTMQCRWPLYDAAGQPAALLTLDVDRKWYIESQNQRDFLLTMIVAAGVMNFILIMVFMDRAILTRINSMMDDIDKIGKGEMKERRVRALGNDELKDLGVQMNIMLEGLDRSEQQLIMKERRYRAVVEGSSNAIMLVDGEDLSIIEANPAMLKMTGHTNFTLEQLPITEVLEVPWEWGTMDHKLDGARVMEGEGKLKHTNGSTLDVELSMTPLRFEGRNCYFILGRDLTERRRAEKERERILDELSRANENLEMTLKSITDGVISVDQDDVIVLMNRAAEELIGVGRRYAVGKKIRDVIPLPDSDWNDYRTLRQGGPSRVVLKTSSGQAWQMEYNFVTLTNEKGELMGKMFTFHDISEKARAEIAEANAGRLEAIGTLAGGIAHDFNNVMTSMMGELYLLRSEIDNSEGSMQRSRERINDMEMAMDRAKFVAQGLLSLAKGGAPIQKPTNLRELLDDTSRLAFTGSSITWSLDCPDDIWAVNIDQGQMNRAFLNILFNAQEASRERGSVEIVVRNVHSRPGPGSDGKYVKVEFIDHGVGIPPEVLPRIFDPYFTTKPTGTGLGMTVTFTTIKRHGGTIEVESEVNKGTRISVYLPATDTKVENEHHLDEPMTGRGRILIMDDEDFILQVSSDILEGLGYRVDTANDGEEALRKYQEAMRSGERFDVVIMDLTVPGGMGGREAIGHLLKMDPDARAIVSSGYCNDPVMAQYKDFGFVGVVPKPYRIEELSYIIKNAMGNDRRVGPEPDRFK